MLDYLWESEKRKKNQANHQGTPQNNFDHRFGDHRSMTHSLHPTHPPHASSSISGYGGNSGPSTQRLAAIFYLWIWLIIRLSVQKKPRSIKAPEREGSPGCNFPSLSLVWGTKKSSPIHLMTIRLDNGPWYSPLSVLNWTFSMVNLLGSWMGGRVLGGGVLWRS